MCGIWQDEDCQFMLSTYITPFCKWGLLLYSEYHISDCFYLENVDCVFKVHIYTVGSCKSVCLNEYEFTTSKRREEQCSVFNSYFPVAIIK